MNQAIGTNFKLKPTVKTILEDDVFMTGNELVNTLKNIRSYMVLHYPEAPSVELSKIAGRLLKNLVQYQVESKMSLTTDMRADLSFLREQVRFLSKMNVLKEVDKKKIENKIFKFSAILQIEKPKNGGTNLSLFE